MKSTKKRTSTQPFTSFLELISERHDRTNVFRDYLSGIISLLSGKSLFEQHIYSLNKYTENERTAFSEALKNMIDWMECHPFEDSFGDYYQEYISRGHNGQYFTPVCIADLMAQLTQPGSEKDTYDPCCGSGRLLLSAAKINRTQNFFGADISELCCMMTIINLCLNDLTGEIYNMNTLTRESWKAWRITRHPLFKFPYIIELRTDYSK